MPILIVVIYDGINNSVFQSQVIAPLLIRKQTDPHLNIHVVSFEKNLQIKLPHAPQITFHIFKRYPFIHNLCLYPNILRLRSVLHRFNCYELLARGPFAGYIAYKAATKNGKHITIQARGLVAEEHRYLCGTKELTVFERYRYAQFLNLEKLTYRINKPSVTFQAVSPALKEYMTNAFATNPDLINIAKNDIPAPIAPEEKDAFRKAVRIELNITPDATVYCYSGSYKAWQCPQETIDFFKELLKTNPHLVLLILTPDVIPFQTAIAQAALPVGTYHICSVTQNRLFSYLAAADFGLLLREEHIINFVSRPTKALEYQAAGLTVIHNDTVDYLKNLTTHETAHPELIKNTSL